MRRARRGLGFHGSVRFVALGLGQALAGELADWRMRPLSEKRNGEKRPSHTDESKKEVKGCSCSRLSALARLPATADRERVQSVSLCSDSCRAVM